MAPLISERILSVPSFPPLPHRRRQRSRVIAASSSSSSSSGEEAQDETQTCARDRRLGRSGLVVSTVGLGTIGWGDENAGFNSRYRATDISQAFESAREGGINFFDTAEVYGYKQHRFRQSSECLLGDFDKDSRENGSGTGSHSMPVVIGSKVFTIPWTNLLVGGSPRLGREALVEALKASVERVGRPLDVWSIHFPFPTFKQGVLMDALKEGLDLGLTKAVGVSNYNAKQLEEANELCDKVSVPLACNQIRYSLLDRKAEKSGLLKLADQLDIAIVAYSPLGGGLLTSNGLNKDPKNAAKLQQLLQLMDFVGTVNGGRSVTQVALNYVVQKGCIPIPSAVNSLQAKEHAGAMEFKLDQNEVAILDEKLDSLKF